MIVLHSASARLIAHESWLTSHRSLPAEVFASLRPSFRVPLLAVVEDRVQPGKGFGAHGHRDMEILSFVRSGALEHSDSLGNQAVIRPGEIQRMSAGTGIRHQEMNGSADQEVSFVQIWIDPERAGIAPGYEQRRYNPDDTLVHLVGPAAPALVHLHQQVDLWRLALDAGETVVLPSAGRRLAWLHMLAGEATIGGGRFAAGGAAALIDEADTRVLGGGGGCEALLFSFDPSR